MRIVRIALFASWAACTASASWAQYGLYGAPDTLRLPQGDPATAATAATTYPITATPQADPALAAASAAPLTQSRYMTKPAMAAYQPPQYSYPAQWAATTTYQPYQPGAQYRYPGPANYRVPVRTAAVDASRQGQPALSPTAEYVPAAPVPVKAGVPLAPQTSGMIGQVLADQPCTYGTSGGSYRGILDRLEPSECWQGSTGCGYDGACAPDACCPWYASVQALVMSRSGARRFWTSYDDADETIQLSNSDFPLSWKWGGEVRFGRRFCCGCTPYAIEATYWTTDPFSGTQITTNPGGLVSTPLNLNALDFGGTPAVDWFMGAQSQTVSRRDEFHNVEVNLIRDQLAWGCDSPWDIGWSLGIRYFRFQEQLTFASLAFDGVSDAYFSDSITNDLVGAQFGFDAAYNIGCNLRLFITPKVGIYDNFLTSNFDAKARAGAGPYVDGVGPYSSFPVHGTASGIAFLTQIDLGADWQITRNWSARAGYRVVAITGMGLADDQFPQYMCDTPEIANVQHMSSLVLHGAFVGATYNF